LTRAINTIYNKNKIDNYIVGIGVAGQIKKETGIIKYSPNLGWHNVRLQSDLAKKIRHPVSICNDVRAATLGEWLYGAGKGYNDFICVFIGTGIGGGIVSNGQLLEGYNNTAGEIGHITVDINGPKCHCGNKGCFEALSGGWAIERDAQIAVRKNKTAGKLLLDIADGKINSITAKTLYKGIRQKDKLSEKLFDNVTKALIAGGVSIVNSFGPQRLILGGGIIKGFPKLLPAIEKGIKKNALKAATSSLTIVSAKLQDDSGVIGAAAFALSKLKKI